MVCSISESRAPGRSSETTGRRSLLSVRFRSMNTL